MSAPMVTVKKMVVSRFDELTPRSFAEQHPLFVERVMQVALVISVAGGACLVLYSLWAGCRVCRLEGLHAPLTLKFWEVILAAPLQAGVTLLMIRAANQQISKARRQYDLLHSDAEATVYGTEFSSEGLGKWYMLTTSEMCIDHLITSLTSREKITLHQEIAQFVAETTEPLVLFSPIHLGGPSSKILSNRPGIKCFIPRCNGQYFSFNNSTRSSEDEGRLPVKDGIVQETLWLSKNSVTLFGKGIQIN